MSKADDALLEAIGEAIGRSLAPLVERIDKLEAGGVKYLGTWQRDKDYPVGSLVSYGGSLWHANVMSRGHKPSDAEMPAIGRLWTLCVKRGRDGKDAR